MKKKVNSFAEISTGRRKSAVARVILTKGDGSFSINQKKFEEYIPFPTIQLGIMNTFKKIIDTMDQYNISVNVRGGGLISQSSAIRLGIAKSLMILHPELRTVLKKEGLLTRDSRIKERKKYGLKKARRAPQFSKR